ncbi:MAG: SDR family NAD(P)-dependent oxidoreductase [Gemmatimonadaceae bacterium]
MSHQRTALITGASSGIGRELARLAAAERHALILVGRRQAALELLADELRASHGVAVRLYAHDLSEPNAAEQLWTALQQVDVTVDILVNNAGVGLYGPLADQEPGAVDRMVQLNAGTLTSLTRLALPRMLQRGWGRILNVASMVGYQPGGPRMAAYYATKAYVLSFSKGLARELRGSGVSVTAVAPGLTKSSFEEGLGGGASETALYKWVPSMSASAVARAAYEGMQRQRTVVIPGWVAKLLAVAGELPPRWVALQVNSWLLRPVMPKHGA